MKINVLTALCQRSLEWQQRIDATKAGYDFRERERKQITVFELLKSN